MRLTYGSLFVTLCAMTLLLASCSTAQMKGEAMGEGEEQHVVASQDAPQQLKVALGASVVSLDPHMASDLASINVARHIYETLVYHDRHMKIKPLLAESWEQMDERTWRFFLRQDVRFSDGTPFNAEVVKINFERLLDPHLGLTRAALFEDWLEDVRVIDEHTVELKTRYPFAPILNHLAQPGASIISSAAIAEDERGERKIALEPVGTGPFILENWQAGQQIELVRNERYWGKAALVDRLIFTFIPEASIRIAMLETGEVHIADAIAPSDVSRVAQSAAMRLVRNDSLGLAYLGFNTEKPPFNDRRVRQALSMAVNKEEIIAGVANGIGRPANGPLPPKVFGASQALWPLPHDPEAAKQLLEDAGYPEGFKATLWTHNHNHLGIEIAEVIQAQLKEIGVDVAIETMEWATFLDLTAQGKHELFILGWVTVTADADYGIYPLFHSRNRGQAGNRSFYSNPELDHLLDQARHESDPKTRRQLYHAAQELLIEEAPLIYLYHPQYLIALAPQVKGFWQHPNGLMYLHQVSLEE